MKLESGTTCPILKKNCIQFECIFWTQLRGSHPQTGKEIDEWDCAIKWLPMLLIENAKEVRQGAAATETFRNIMFRLAAGESPEQIAGSSNYKGLLENGSEKAPN